MPDGQTDRALIEGAENETSLSAFERSVRTGLSAQPKTLEPKYFYDDAGSALFEQITDLPEYYLTRAETEILSTRASEMAGIIGPDAELVELGSGASVKTRLLLSALADPGAYIPIDISADHMEAAAKTLRALHPGLAVRPVAADFSLPLALPNPMTSGRRVLFFPGSTIGNLEPDEARIFLERMRHETRSDMLIIGVDLRKERHVLEAAYDDADRVTAAFNLNLLVRINRELGGEFEIDAFKHEARYNDTAGRVEMHLVSLSDQTVAIGSFDADFKAGESIHSENSYKYTLDGFQALAREGGWKSRDVWTDSRQRFSVHLMVPA
ncbi:MAG: L-histidine N(alpha)-methyltransferase [Pseudomonadota bacterium]